VPEEHKVHAQASASKNTDPAGPSTAQRLGEGIARGAVIVAGLTIVSRILGLVRTLVFSQTVGASCLGTAYVTANQVPDLLYQLILGGALTSAMVPVLARSAERAHLDPAEKDRVGQITSALLTWTVILTVPLVVIIVATAGPIASLLNPSNPNAHCVHADVVSVTSSMLQVFAPQALFYGLSVVLYGLLQSYRRFVGPSIGPGISSLVLIVCYLLYVPLDKGRSLAQIPLPAELILSAGTTVGIAVLVVVALPPTWRLRLRLRLALRFPPGVARRAGGLALVGVVELVAIDVANVIAIRLANGHGKTGAVVLFNYGSQVFNSISAILALSIVVSAFPVLSAREGADFDRASAGSTRAILLMSWLGTAVIAAIAIPAAHVLAKQSDQVSQLVEAFLLFAPGIAGAAVIANLSRVMFVIGRLKVAAVALAGSWVITIVASIVLVELVPANQVVAMLALATTIGQTVVAIPLVFVTRRICGAAAVQGAGRATLAGLAACAVSCAVGVGISVAVPLHHKLVAAALAVPAAACAILAFLAVAYFLDDGDLKTVLAWVRRTVGRRSLQVAAPGLLPLDRLEQCFEVPLAEALRPVPLDQLEEHRRAVLHRLGEDLQQVPVLVAVGQDAQLVQLVQRHPGLAHPGAELLVVAGRGGQELDPGRGHGPDAGHDVVGGQRDVLDAGTAVELQVLVDLRLALAGRGLVQRELDLPGPVRDHLAHQRGILGGDVVADEFLHVREAHDPVVEVHPFVHLAELDVADAVVDLGEESTSAPGPDGLGRDVSGQVGARVTGPLDQRVPGVAVGGDGGQHGLAVVVLDDARLGQPARSVRDRVAVGVLGRADLQGQVDDPVSVRGDPVAQRGAGPDRAAEDEPRAAGFQDVGGLVRRSGLRSAVRHPSHAERGRVVVRRLLRVADREDYGVHADDGEGVPGWRRHAASMPTRLQTAQPCASLLVRSPIYTERNVVSLYSMTTREPGSIDPLDAALIELLASEPRVGALEASRRLGVARGTVQARLDRMRDRGVITGYGPDVDPAAVGYEVTAFVTLEISQAGGHDPVADRLAAIPEVLEVHTITGAGDMLCRVVARTNADLQRVLDAIVSARGVVRASTVISLATQVSYRVLPLVRAASANHGTGGSGRWDHIGLKGTGRGMYVTDRDPAREEMIVTRSA
jgi:putative peptidoglycan lipid II flippase